MLNGHRHIVVTLPWGGSAVTVLSDVTALWTIRMVS
jgi:hypothetical protein